jgi:two-component system phosphate regulon sensor histidine kinase PhoR
MIAAVVSSGLIFGLFYQKSYENTLIELEKEALIYSAGLETGGFSYLQELKSAPNRSLLNRITLIDVDGTVLFDNFSNYATMVNHNDRPEVIEARSLGSSQSIRSSSTLRQQTFYFALLLPNQQVLRTAVTIDSIWTSLLQLVPWYIFFMTLIGGFSFFMAHKETKRLLQPLNSLDLNHPLENDTYEELSPLLGRIEQQNRQLQNQLTAMEKAKFEFETITKHMSNGLILLNGQKEILTINTAAIQMLELPKDNLLGRNLLLLTRSLDLKTFFDKLTCEQSEEMMLNFHRKTYQFLAHPVCNDGILQGAVLFLLDVTDRQAADQLRREFTANVSHELKTPLQSISGYAEIIKNGLVKPEDVPQFVERIHQESQRLIHLVEDIIKISKLDENKAPLNPEPVELYSLAEGVLKRLQPQIEGMRLQVKFTGVPVYVMGSKVLLEEMIFNLCDNAIKYNKLNGSLEVTTQPMGEAIMLRVKDSGMGIELEDQNRVFERFFRADKTHSRKIDGTGLGLAIVKHGARLHGASIDLLSKPGKGTQISILFPKIQDSVN